MAFFDTNWYINYGNGSSTGYYAVGTWTALHAYSAGQWVRQLATPATGSERCFVCIIAGTSLAAEPTWVVTRGAKTAEAAGPTWQECTGMAGPNEATQTNAPTWTTVKNAAVTLGEVIYDSASSSLQICSTAGTAGNGATPGFSATAGTTTADNTITWTSLGNKSSYTGWQYPHARIANSVTATWGAAGNTFYVSNNHGEAQATALTINWPNTTNNPVSVLCVTDTASPPTTTNSTATVTCTSGSISIGGAGTAYVYGISFVKGGSDNANLNVCNGANNNSQIYDNCVFNTTDTTTFLGVRIGAVSNYVKFNNCSFLFGATSHGILPGNAQSNFSPLLFIGCTFAATGSVPSTLIGGGFGNANGYVIMRGCDLSKITGNLVGINQTPCTLTAILENCKLAGGVVPMVSQTTGLALLSVRMHNCDSANTNYRFYSGNYAGSMQQETTVVRTGGATNGTTQVSWAITTTANSATRIPFSVDLPYGEEIAVWNTNASGAQTATIYLTSNSTLDNSQFWAELEYLGTSSFPLGNTVTSQVALLASPVTLTSDGSTWGGAISNKYKIVLNFTPTQVGPVKIRLFCATPSITVYVDPYVAISGQTSGRQYLLPGGVYINEGSSGGATGGLLTNPGMSGGLRG